MPAPSLSRCATPAIGKRRTSTYTVLGFFGYAMATVLVATLAIVFDLPLGMRINVLMVPGTAFVIVVTIAALIKGRDWIVFYQTSAAGVFAVALVALATGTPVWRQVDLATLGIGTFLVFGRLGCFHVACCHGRPARRGVAYGPRHVAVGFWKRWQGRTLAPVQLVESAGSAMLVTCGILVSGTPGNAAVLYATGYAMMRFTLELWRGDPVRPFAQGLSEGQWSALVTIVIAAIARPTWWTIPPAALVAIAAALLATRRVDRELFLPPHLREVDRVCDEVFADPEHARRDTRLGVGVSFHALSDGRVDWVMSSEHPRWSAGAARRLAELLWVEPEIVEGRTPGVIHVLVARAAGCSVSG